jgi:excisionase family DNA binding protein
MIQHVQGVLLDRDDAAYLCEALELLAQLLPSQQSRPSPRLVAVTAKLRRAADAAADPGPKSAANGRESASQSNSRDDAPYAVISTAEAARVIGCGTRNVRDLARRGRLRARRAGGRWNIDAMAVAERIERRSQE